MIECRTSFPALELKPFSSPFSRKILGWGNPNVYYKYILFIVSLANMRDRSLRVSARVERVLVNLCNKNLLLLLKPAYDMMSNALLFVLRLTESGMHL